MDGKAPDPWEKAYVYGRTDTTIDIGGVAHILDFGWYTDSLCGQHIGYLNRIPKPYPVCKNCLRTKRAKELGL